MAFSDTRISIVVQLERQDDAEARATTATKPSRRHGELPPLVVAHAYTPNESGSYGGGDHLVVTEACRAGRLLRDKGQALCESARRRFWGLEEVSNPIGRRICPRCREVAELRGVDVDALVSPPEEAGDTQRSAAP